MKVFVTILVCILFILVIKLDFGKNVRFSSSVNSDQSLNHKVESNPQKVNCFFPGMDCQSLLQPIKKDGQILGYGVLLPQDSTILSPVWGEATGGQLNIIADNQFKGFPMTVIYPDKDARPARIEFIFAQPQKFIAKTLNKGERITEIAANPAVIDQFGRFDLIIRAFDAQDKLIDPRSYLDKP